MRAEIANQENHPGINRQVAMFINENATLLDKVWVLVDLIEGRSIGEYSPQQLAQHLTEQNAVYLGRTSEFF